jgi:hypothetical protein
VRVGRWWDLARIALDRARARRAAEWGPSAVVADQKKGLGGVVRVRTRLAHELSITSTRRCAVRVAW